MEGAHQAERPAREGRCADIDHARQPFWKAVHQFHGDMTAQ